VDEDSRKTSEEILADQRDSYGGATGSGTDMSLESDGPGSACIMGLLTGSSRSSLAFTAVVASPLIDDPSEGLTDVSTRFPFRSLVGSIVEGNVD